MRTSRIIFAFLASAVFFAASLFAQSANGTINGLILDPSGRVITGADVLVINDATGVKYSTKTNREGIYVLPNLSPGPYRIQVSKVGFKTLIKPDIVLNVQDALSINFTLPIGAVSDSVTVEGGAPLVNTESAAVSTVIDRTFVANLPLNGRSFNTLLQLTPGVVIAPVPNSQSPGQFSIAGQRTDANSFSVDGVSANFGVSGSFFAGQSGTGAAQAFSAVGGTSSLVSVDDLQEFRIETSSFAPEFGRAPGGQVLLTTRSGTNDFHGGIFDYFRNDVMDANDWFANRAGEARAAERHNDFGGFLGGPLRRDRTFLFFSYEGARLRLPQTQIIQVPSAGVRTAPGTPPAVVPFLNAYPLPNGPISPDGFTAQFTGTFSNSATLNATSLRIDHTLSNRFSIFGRYNYAPSETSLRSANLAELDTSNVNTQTLTIGANMAFGNDMFNAFRGNYSRQQSDLLFALNAFGGSSPIDPGLLLGPLPARDNSTLFGTFDTATFSTGPNARNLTQQMNLVDDFEFTYKTHHLKVGTDYRAIFLDTNPRQHLVELLSPTVQDFVTSGQGLLTSTTSAPSQLLAQSYSLYGQDTWKAGSRLTLTYGIRWEIDPAPSARGSTKLASWRNVDSPADLTLAPAGASVWATSYGNVAPRFGLAYALTQKGDLVVRGGVGLFYDIGVGSSANLASDFPNFATGPLAPVSLPITDPTPFLAVLSEQPPFPFFVEGFDPNLNQPRSLQWNLSLEKSFGTNQALSLTYLGQDGTQLLRQSDLFVPNPNFTGTFALTGNDAHSNYNALQIQYRRRLTSGVQALLNYSWSHSLDNASNDVVAGLSNTIISAQNDYASSDFDARHSFSGAVTYDIPAVSKSGLLSKLTDHWSTDVVVVARSGFPFNARIAAPSETLGISFTRPDLVAGQPVWISNPLAPGGKALNPNAFAVPATVMQGTEPRNDIGGFGLVQTDFSVARRFPIWEQVSLQFRADAFNVFNHPNFSKPSALIGFSPSNLSSTAMLNQGLGGLNPLFQEGGPRSLQLSLKLTF